LLSYSPKDGMIEIALYLKNETDFLGQ
jgi:hypothetical protein